jgi:hypothetical protein
VRYELQQAKWDEQNVLPYFLSSEEAYTATRDNLLVRTMAFRQIDLREIDEMDAFAADLTTLNAEVVGANVTNVFSTLWAYPDAGLEFIERMPFHPDAQIIDSAANTAGSRAYLPIELIAHYEELVRNAHRHGKVLRYRPAPEE